ncbi:MAG: hypothetical protein O9346_09805 [Leptospiraceae bacterium]|jgi:hypothetical protein|nr:hypothetical protein [Leptospiraceae bacterium]MCZ8237820.1 hypothetical protein [Leptospiraceae bacterium]MCZ8346699.1 hypothetical protein [Leptospiraceae bacterium]PJE03378.1 MAG: hypothetical protein CK427_05050 [Leptospira sp.]
MEIYCTIELGLSRYLRELNISPNILFKMAILDPPSPENSFLKARKRFLKGIHLECMPEEFDFLFTQSFHNGKYIGEMAEEYILHAFLKYIH